MNKHAILIIDESGSMFAQRMKVVNGINTFIQQLKDVPELRFSLVFFHNIARYIYQNIPISQVQPISYMQYYPQQFTALYDTVFRVLTEFQELRGENIVYIITDGYDTKSEVTKQTMNNTILQFKNTGYWKFVLCDTDINRLSVSSVPTIQYNVDDVDALISNLMHLQV